MKNLFLSAIIACGLLHPALAGPSVVVLDSTGVVAGPLLASAAPIAGGILGTDAWLGLVLPSKQFVYVSIGKDFQETETRFFFTDKYCSGTRYQLFYPQNQTLFVSTAKLANSLRIVVPDPSTAQTIAALSDRYTYRGHTKCTGYPGPTNEFVTIPKLVGTESFGFKPPFSFKLVD